MSWIGLCAQGTRWFNPDGLETGTAWVDPVTDEIAAQGTLTLECRMPSMDENREIIAYQRSDRWTRGLVMTLTPQGGLRMKIRQGETVSRARVSLPDAHEDTPLRVTYVWDSPARSAHLVVETLDDGQRYRASARDPLPLPLTDIASVLTPGGGADHTDGLKVLAVANSIEPDGLPPGLAPDTLVETPDGPRPAHSLRLGDRVITAQNGVQTLRWITRRRLPACGRHEPVRLRAPYFGLTSDLVVSADHKLRLRGSDAEYLFGVDQVLVSAGDLVDGTVAVRDAQGPLADYIHLLFDEHDLICHAGLWGESLYLPRVARGMQLRKEMGLGDLPDSALPNHQPLRLQTLSAFEAQTLATALCA